MKKVHATRTYAPLQFEALEPRRFEDLVRGLLHDFKDWQNIEAVGRGGTDGGFDARAFERKTIEESVEEETETDKEEPITAEGNLWKIQCKRQKVLSASGIKTIIEEGVSKDAPPYGYILAAPVDFTKKSYDAFRSSLIERGVTEFHLWGRGELEDMLFQPKNDGLLFAFFGFSLVSKKRSKVMEIRKSVNNKNKLLKVLGEGGYDHPFSVNVLVRDINDTFYPHESKYPDFKTNPRWKEYIALSHHAEGVEFRMKKSYAYIDREKKEWDFIPSVDLVHRRVYENEKDEVRKERLELYRKALDFWEHLPLTCQAVKILNGFVPYRDFDLIDKEGDVTYKMPHMYVDFSKGSPFDGYWDFLTDESEREYISYKDYKQISIFPKILPEAKYGKVYKDKQLEVPSYMGYRLRDGQHSYFDLDNKYAFLKQRDVIGLPNPDAQSSEKMYVEIMYKRRAKASEIIKSGPQYEWEMEQQVGRKVQPNEGVNLLQLKKVYDFQFEKNIKPI